MDAPFEGREVVTDTYVSDGDGRYTPGRLDAVAYAYFTEGWCWALAVVLADRYGWPVWGLGELEDWEHVVAAPAPGMFVDISGMHRERLDGWASRS